MKKITILILMSFIINLCFSQKIKIEHVIKNDSLPKREKKDFFYLAKETDITKAKYIGRLKATNKFSYIDMVIYLLKDQAQKRGANSFKFVDFKNKDGINQLVIDVYVIGDEIKKINQDNLPKNNFFFFGKDNLGKEIIEEYSLNDEPRKIKSFHYTVMEFDKPMKVTKGKAFGTSVKVKPNENGDSMFISFSGFGASSISTPSGGIGIGFSGGNVTLMDSNYGFLLTNIYSRE
ncbi:hypothetical protein OKE80_03905 [Riemerella anatipestifer]|uniref:Uncharacterized protein n=1 Tax=Riemerella anatipestifer TaxID=34085 RepID=A0AAP3AMV1_RIEAN|nr:MULTISPECIES: hypothetical protein [Weeksellaceae]MBT0572166.1 hypothetical protein [Riemerella anatipestifer]MCO7318502.1 hypothetical protein [Riemerella anatipestifer]MCQ4154863.1 hypothetical protein [Riemerella anatipestifer]MCQ4180816.1 hypothetical protein [Riemerella anatipestifer]MCU7569084.1 hypothetical protein [Riemerella anatipestifer]